MLTIIARGIWGFQVLFGFVILILSVILVKQQYYGAAPATLGYAAFAGAFVAIAAVVGLVSTFMDRIPELVVIGVDALGALFALAGGIAFVIGTKGFTCDVHEAKNLQKMEKSSLMTEGTDGDTAGIVMRTCKSGDSQEKCSDKLIRALEGRCKQLVADQSLLFIAFGLATAAGAMAFFIWRKGKRGGGARYYA